MSWLVVAPSKPLAHRPPGIAQAQPPGPGFPEQAPSVYTVVVVISGGNLTSPVVAEPEPIDDDRPQVLDELDEQFDRFRLLRKSDESATDAFLDELGATSKVDKDIVLELSATRVIGKEDQFERAHDLAMRSLEVLDRNGARPVSVPGWLNFIGMKQVAGTLVQWTCRYIVRKHQAKLVDRIADIYERRVTWSVPGDPMRRRLLVAARDIRRVGAGYKGNPVGVPAFLLGGAFISAVSSGVRALTDAALGNQFAAGGAVAILTLLFVAIAWVIVRGSAVARRRIRLTTDRPMKALWDVIGRCGNPPVDQARTFALTGIALTAVSWLVIPAGVVFIFSKF